MGYGAKWGLGRRGEEFDDAYPPIAKRLQRAEYTISTKAPLGKQDKFCLDKVVSLLRRWGEIWCSGVCSLWDRVWVKPSRCWVVVIPRNLGSGDRSLPEVLIEHCLMCHTRGCVGWCIKVLKERMLNKLSISTRHSSRGQAYKGKKGERRERRASFDLVVETARATASAFVKGRMQFLTIHFSLLSMTEGTRIGGCPDCPIQNLQYCLYYIGQSITYTVRNTWRLSKRGSLQYLRSL